MAHRSEVAIGGKQDSRTILTSSSLNLSNIVHTAVCDGMIVRMVSVESVLTGGYAGIQLIGHAGDICKDGIERAKAALGQIGVELPAKRIVISLTPADLKKDGNHLDLPLAISLALLTQLSHRRHAQHRDLSQWMFVGEVGLDGHLRPCKNLVSFVLAALEQRFTGVIMPQENLKEVSTLAKLKSCSTNQSLSIRAFNSLSEVLEWVFSFEKEDTITLNFPCERSCDKNLIKNHGDYILESTQEDDLYRNIKPNFDDMVLSPELSLAIQVAAVGMHNMLLRGSPGTGKSMLAERFSSILPPMAADDHIECLRIHGMLTERISESLLIGRPSYRAPHHQASAAAVLGSVASPGEMSLAHGGVLFLDELPEFRRDLLEALREPLETGVVKLSRAQHKVNWPARILLLAACNNCPCGYLQSSRQPCRCTSNQIRTYQQKLSGPILERIDMHLAMPEYVGQQTHLFVHVADESQIHSSSDLAAQINRARQFAADCRPRWQSRLEECMSSLNKGLPSLNRDLQSNQILAASGLSKKAFLELTHEVLPTQTSTRSALRMLRIARSCADIEQSEKIQEHHLRQALTWRPSQDPDPARIIQTVQKRWQFP